MQRSLLGNVKDVYLEKRKSKSGNDYDSLVIEFEDGYKSSRPVFGDTAYILNQQLTND